METESVTVDPRARALARHLDCSTDDVSEGYRDGVFEHGRSDYLVLTDEEADDLVRERIEESLWAFNAEFIASHTKPRLAGPAVKALREVQEKLCERANDLVLALIDDFDRFVQDAIGADGRGHFLAQHDGHENEIKVDGTFYYIYRE